MKQVAFLIVVVLAIIPQGYGLKCFSCRADNQIPNGCQTPAEVTCPVFYDRCSTIRYMTEMNIPGGGSINTTMEVRECSRGALTCTKAYKQQSLCQPLNMTSSGGLKYCNYSCCDRDLCNDGTNPPDSGLIKPSKPASNVSLSCYECSPEGMGPNGTGTPLTSCRAPKQRKCGNYAPGVPYDRCMTVKTKVKNPKTGALLEQETKNCSVSSMMCSGNMFCNSMNSTGGIVKCDVQCCDGNLCNGGPQTTVGPSSTGPKAGQTPLAVSGILVLISIIMALLFK